MEGCVVKGEGGWGHAWTSTSNPIKTMHVEAGCVQVGV